MPKPSCVGFSMCGFHCCNAFAKARDEFADLCVSDSQRGQKCQGVATRSGLAGEDSVVFQGFQQKVAQVGIGIARAVVDEKAEHQPHPVRRADT